MYLTKAQALGLFAYCTAKGMAVTGDLVIAEQRGDGELWINAATIAGIEVVVLPPTGGWRVVEQDLPNGRTKEESTEDEPTTIPTISRASNR